MTYSKSYLSETDIDISSDIISRKEFLMFKKSVEISKFATALQESDDKRDIIPKFLIANNIPESNYLEFKSYQMLTRNYLNPNTPYSRLLLKWETGHGKTIAAIAIAMNFISYYKKQDNDESKIGSVYIIGFTQNIFKDELLKYPDFGFISHKELAQLNILKKLSHTGNVTEIERLRKFYTVLKKRLYNRKDNGFFKFIGYKELTNHLFMQNDSEIANLKTMDEIEIFNLIKSGKLKVNKELLNEFKNSFIICDEIHNVYNTLEKNNWGVTLQTILNHHDSCRALFLSATPLNNSPTEIIDLVNLLLPKKYYASLTKLDFFDTVDKIQILKKSKEVELGNYLKGRVSFIRERNPNFIATKHMLGESIAEIDYLKFIRCPMNKFHYNTYKQIALNSSDTLGIDGQYLVDYLIPNPFVKDAYKSKELGLYKPNDIKDKISDAPALWRQKNGIAYNQLNGVITGTVLKQNNINMISQKYSSMIDIILKNIETTQGKMFIYHNYIHMSGTLFIQEILTQNNIIGEFDTSNNNTLCICGKQKHMHGKDELEYLTDAIHYFQPVRFTIVHSNLERAQIIRSLEKFNNSSNVTGNKIMILIGSKIMKEAHSINSVRNILVMSRPDNISSLIQIIGRAIRLNSHKLLPRNQQNVNISIIVSSMPDLKTLSYEENKYKEKIQTFKVIQQIEKIMHINAIDNYFNYDTIWNLNSVANNSTPDNFGLDILPYEITKFKLTELNLNTFNAYHAKFQVDYFISIIKRLFIEVSSVWSYKDLYAAVKSPPFSIEINTLITPNIFNIALNTIIYIKSIKYIEPDITNLSDDLIETNLMEKIQNPDDKIILYNNNIKYVITHLGELYTLVPIYNQDIYVKIESLFRIVQPNQITYVDVMQYLKHEVINSYESKKIRFINKWKFTNIIDLEQSLCDFGTNFHAELIEDIIQYMFTIFTKSNEKKAENHAFYLKMLYFYDLQRLIIWANFLDNELEKKYAKYVTPVSLKLQKDIDFAIVVKNNNGEINQLITTLNRTNKEWLSTGLIKEYKNNLHESDKLFDKVYQKSKNPKKVLANLLPVGYCLRRVPRYYLPSGWYDHDNIEKNIEENNIVVGYDQRTNTGVTVKFKLRPPIHKNKVQTDTRLNKRGETCSTKSKSYLNSLAKKLNIEVTNSLSNSEKFCVKIRQRLIYLELKEKNKEHPVKYFYSVLS